MKRALERLTTEHVVLCLLGCVGLVVGSRTLDDNSTLVHLRTGLEIYSTHHIPTSDPYSFTANGAPWVVQSWFAEAMYGFMHAIGGFQLVQVLNAVLLGLTAFVTAVLARAGSMIRTAGAGLVALLIALPLWSPRPLLFGFFCLALVVFVTLRQKSPLWLLPLGWLWVNTHGSFPIGVAWMVLCLVGAWIDGSRPQWNQLRYLVFLLVGLAVGGINPLGPKLLVFWLSASSNPAFSHITEWKSPDFHDGIALVLLVGLVSAALILTRRTFKWQTVLPVVFFTACTLWSVRYAPYLSIVIAPALGLALMKNKQLPSDGVVAPEAAGTESRLITVGGVIMSGLAAITVVTSIYSRPAFDFERYPQMAYQSLDDQSLKRVLAQDWVGCYDIFRTGGGPGRVFIDDRYDLYPTNVAQDYFDLSKGNGDTKAILERYAFDAVVWQRNTPLTNYLSNVSGWTRTYADAKWVVFRPSSTVTSVRA